MSNKYYDFLIVGTGPTALTLATILSQYEKKICLIERESSIGGCHRVRRVDGYFTEHGPRIYLSNANTSKSLFKSMNMDFNSYFVPYNFNITGVGGDSVNTLNTKELGYLTIAFMKLTFNNKYGLDQTMFQFMEERDFSDESKRWIDNICRLTDGAGADRYTVFEFLQAVNQHVFYGILQPKRPNDIGFLADWKKHLISTGSVDFKMNSNVTNIIHPNSKSISYYENNSFSDKNNDIERGVVLELNNHQKVHGENVILAVPSQALLKIKGLGLSNMRRNKLEKWHKGTNYMVYIPIMFHWKKKIDLPKIWGFPRTDWGIAFIVMTDYMKFGHPGSQTVISTCISRPDAISKVIDKTPNQCNSQDLITEVFRQLRESYPNIEKYDKAILSPGVDKVDGKWITRDSSFILTPDGYWTGNENGMGFQLNETNENVYWVGSQSGHQKYHFTSFESAVSNGVALANQLIPDSKKKFKIKGSLGLDIIIRFIVLLLVFGLIVFGMGHLF